MAGPRRAEQLPEVLKNSSSHQTLESRVAITSHLPVSYENRQTGTDRSRVSRHRAGRVAGLAWNRCPTVGLALPRLCKPLNASPQAKRGHCHLQTSPKAASLLLSSCPARLPAEGDLPLLGRTGQRGPCHELLCLKKSKTLRGADQSEDPSTSGTARLNSHGGFLVPKIMLVKAH